MSAHSKTKIVIGRDYPSMVIPLIEQAKDSIKIIAYHWRFYPQQPKHPVTLFTEALKAAVARGVYVKVLVGSEILRHHLSGCGFEVKNYHSEKLVHAKMLLIDNKTAIVGSHNFTHSAFLSNLEVSLIVDLGIFDNELQQYFDMLWPF